MVMLRQQIHTALNVVFALLVFVVMGITDNKLYWMIPSGLVVINTLIACIQTLPRQPPGSVADKPVVQ